MATRLIIGAFAVFVAGWAPILLYALLGPADGNPIGLGLLAWASIPVTLILAIMAGIMAILNRRDGSG